jgi:hypothetical protein
MICSTGILPVSGMGVPPMHSTAGTATRRAGKMPVPRMGGTPMPRVARPPKWRAMRSAARSAARYRELIIVLGP